LVPLGFALGAYGTLIGAGGGFVLALILLLLYPHERPETITGICFGFCWPAFPLASFFHLNLP
jgi:uncharacterized membrane protein YfcA